MGKRLAVREMTKEERLAVKRMGRKYKRLRRKLARWRESHATDR